MADSRRHSDPEPDPVEPDERDDAGGEPSAAQAGQAPEQVIDQLRSERDEAQSKLIRAFADYQNYVRRAEQNVVVAREQQLMDMARALLTVLDHFDKALEIDPKKSSAESLLKGVQIVRDELNKVLERFGIQRLETAVGDEFDPMRHEALMRQQVEGLEQNQITQQLQPGYALGDKIIRPVKVAVAE